MKIDIYTIKGCQYCENALNFFKEKNIDVYNHDITDNVKEMRCYLAKKYDIKGLVTLPQIIIDGQRIGGYTDLIKSKKFI